MEKDFKPYHENNFRCRCGCGGNGIKKEVVDLCNNVYALSGIYFKINSGFRCYYWNREVNGSMTSSHLAGKAVDFNVNGSVEKFKLVKALIESGVTRIGIGSEFIHCDIDSDKTQDVIWLY